MMQFYHWWMSIQEPYFSLINLGLGYLCGDLAATIHQWHRSRRAARRIAASRRITALLMGRCDDVGQKENDDRTE